MKKLDPVTIDILFLGIVFSALIALAFLCVKDLPPSRETYQPENEFEKFIRICDNEFRMRMLPYCRKIIKGGINEFK